MADLPFLMLKAELITVIRGHYLLFLASVKQSVSVAASS